MGPSGGSSTPVRTASPTTCETAVAATKDRVYAFLEPDGGPDDTRLVALDRASGRRVWEKVVDAHIADHILVADTPTVLVDGARVYVARCWAGSLHVDAFARGTGAHRWSRDIVGNCGSLRLFGPDHLLALSGFGSVFSLSRKTGTTGARGKRVFVGSVREGVVVTDLQTLTVQRPSGPGASYRVPDGDYLAPFAPFGVRPDRIVVGVRQKATRTVALVGFDRRASAATWTVDLGGSIFTHFRSDGDTLVALDPETGAIARATSFPPAFLVANELPVQDFRFGQLWVAAEHYARPAALPYAVVDLTTDAVTHTGGDMRPRDMTAKVRAAWR